MGEIVNLRRFRKAEAKSSAEKLAAENRRRFGQTLAERNLNTARASIEDRRLAGHFLTESKGQDHPRGDGTGKCE